jgi:transcriptional regulator with PAS, ATPase and Fis domain
MACTDDKQSLKSAKHDLETAYIRQVFEANDFRSGRAAKALDIHYSALIKKIKTKGITINKPVGVSNGL